MEITVSTTGMIDQETVIALVFIAFCLGMLFASWIHTPRRPQDEP